ncbi:hypothetical protein BofuT4_P071260.1 [Botrytis cinerea T4]|uniref:CCHC-type domain-containing protein n=1 Tax=Botryotinia fuckeliana (strain T4) TaxID=999810 RepID=G2XPU2_BOTF4|nr:hypothetical protein BofuT4_P071260.1 [Botrytis cinerea T4]
MNRRNTRGRSRSQPPEDRTNGSSTSDDIFIIRVPASMTHRIPELMGQPPQELQASQVPDQNKRSDQNKTSGNGTGNENSNSNAQNGSNSENGGRPNSNTQNGSKNTTGGRPSSNTQNGSKNTPGGRPNSNTQNGSKNAPGDRPKSRAPSRNGRKSQTNTEANNADVEEVVTRTKSTRWYNAMCGWCGQKGHRVLRCPGPPDQATGQIHACAFCNSRTHISEQCKDNFDTHSNKDWEGLERIMLVMRRNLPMLACTVAPGNWPDAKPGKVYENCRPWTGDFALKYEAEHPDYAKDYVVNKLKEDDVDLGTDPWWANPVTNLRYRLCVPKPSRVVDSEFILFRKRRLDDREMTDDDSNRKIQRTDVAESNNDSPMEPEASSAPVPNAPLSTNDQQERRDSTDDAFDLRGSSMTNCTNCGGEGHESKQCSGSCGACGSSEHTKEDCWDPEDVSCVCMPFPRHMARDCQVECRSPYCYGQVKHQAVTCSMQCCQCGAAALPDPEGQPQTKGFKKHPATVCPLKRSKCALCHGDHITAQCPSMMTDGPDACKAQHCNIWYCDTHCQKCFFNGHKRGECPNEIITKADQSFVLKCPIASHPEMVLGAQEHCPVCRSDRVKAAEERSGSKGRVRGGGQRGGHQNGGNHGGGGGQGKEMGGGVGNRGGGGQRGRGD